MKQPTYRAKNLLLPVHPVGVSSGNDPPLKTIFESRYNGPHLRGTPFYAVLDNHYHYGNALARVEYARLNKGSGQWQMDDLYYRRDLGQTEDGRVLMRIVFRLSEESFGP